jgi:hypothetical protein
MGLSYVATPTLHIQTNIPTRSSCRKSVYIYTVVLSLFKENIRTDLLSGKRDGHYL